MDLDFHMVLDNLDYFQQMYNCYQKPLLSLFFQKVQKIKDAFREHELERILLLLSQTNIPDTSKTKNLTSALGLLSSAFQTQTKVAEASRCLSLPYSYMQGPVGGLTHVRRLHLARVWVVCHRRRRRQGRGRRRWQRRVMQMKRVHRSGSGLTHSRRLHPHLHGCAQSLITPREQVMIKL